MIATINNLPTPWNVIVWILIALAVIGVLVLLYVFRKTPFVKRLLFALVCRAEEIYGSKTGQLKFHEVYLWFSGRCPLLSLFIPESVMKKWIEAAVAKMKQYISDGGSIYEASRAGYVK